MLKQIENDEQYENALAKVYSLMQKEIKPGSKDSDDQERTSILIQQYE